MITPLTVSDERSERMIKILDILDDLPDPVVAPEELPDPEATERMRRARRRESEAWRSDDQ